MERYDEGLERQDELDRQEALWLERELPTMHPAMAYLYGVGPMQEFKEEPEKQSPQAELSEQREQKVENLAQKTPGS
jgi:hypothetical protein